MAANSIQTRIPGFELKKATPGDVSQIYFFIRQIAIYEKLLHEVVSTEDDVRDVFFKPDAKVFCVLAYFDDMPVGFAVYYFNFSTFLCKYGLYLEDLFILPEFRGKGFGKSLLLYLTKIAAENNCGRMEWAVLDWNQPAIEFYKSLGAKPMDEWTVFRLNESNLAELSQQF
jgi:GNAT superfamily N-acetyltransferase